MKGEMKKITLDTLQVSDGSCQLKNVMTYIINESWVT